ncbi:MAG: molybdenum ABC transporter permease, partial [Lachnospiraceae bacterium]|nr:molybdenum ABC transporter permease [Lachnospiraceae bacterium]
PTVVGFFLLIVFGKNTPVGRMLTSIGIDIIFTPTGAVIAACVVSFPIIYRTVRGAFENIDTELVDVARIYGCSEMSILFRIYIPLCWQEIAAGTIIAFARAIGEFGATVMIAGNIPGRTRTMSVAVYTAMQSGNRAEAYRWVCLILLLSVAVLLILNFWSGIQFTSDPDVFRKKKKNLPEDMKE